MPKKQARQAPLYAYIGESYGPPGGKPAPLSVWRDLFHAAWQINGLRDHELFTCDGGKTYLDPISGETILERLPDTRKEKT